MGEEEKFKIPSKEPPTITNGGALNRWMAIKDSLVQRVWPLRSYSREMVAKHNQREDCWVIMNGIVLDITHFLKYHPGGADILIKYAGQDITNPFCIYPPASD